MDLNRARRRSALAAVLALAASPNGFTVTGFAEQVRVMTGQSIAGYSARHASYDLTQDPREAPGVDKPGRTRPADHDQAVLGAAVLDFGQYRGRDKAWEATRLGPAGRGCG